MGLVVMPSRVVVDAVRNERSLSVCGVATGLVQQLCHRVVVLTVMLVSIDRCVAVCTPLRYNAMLTFRATGWGLTIAWLESALVSCLNVFALRSHVTFHPAAVLCSPPPLRQGALWPCAAVEAKLSMFAPACVIAVMFVLIVRSAHAHRRVFAPLPPLAAVTGTASARTPVDYRKSTLRSMRTLFVVVAALAVFWVPDAGVEVYDYVTGSTTTGTGAVVAAWITCASSGVNPLIFLSNRKIRERLSQLIGRGRGVTHTRVQRLSTTGATCRSSVVPMSRNVTLKIPSSISEVHILAVP